ncbi:MAG TPA: hypothetical protein VMU84_11030 [Thermoanaerobaculia bacterium]|nr:hypothetical protein [Thermoanaerobaculia bacterium]
MHPPKISVAVNIRRGHGEIFADEWYDSSRNSGTIWDACATTRLLTWPEDDEAAQENHHALTDEICKRTFEKVRSAIAEAFTEIAIEVLTRERKRG